MGAIITDAGERTIADKFTNKNAGSVSNANMNLKLFKNDYTPRPQDQQGAYVEADFTGYAPKTGLSNAWNAAVTVNGQAYVALAPAVFTKSGATGNLIYGWYLVDSLGVVIFAERFVNAPIDMNINGAQITVTVQFKLFDPNS